MPVLFEKNKVICFFIVWFEWLITFGNYIENNFDFWLVSTTDNSIKIVRK